MPAFTSPFGGSIGATPTIDLDFINGVYYVAPGNDPNPLTVVRSQPAYVDNSAGVWTLVPANTLRQTDKGALIEEERINRIRNNSMQGAVAGTPGTLPTNWRSTVPSGLTTTINLGIQNGVEYIEFNWSGTTTSAGTISVDFESPTGLPNVFGSYNVNMALSAFISNSSSVGITSLKMQMHGLDNNGNEAGFTVYQTADCHGVTALTRQKIIQAAPSLGAYISCGIVTNSISTNTTVNTTVRVGWPQFETPVIYVNNWYGGGSVTSPIRTTGSTVVRPCDVVSLTKPPIFSSSMVPTYPTPYPFAFTVFAQATPTSGYGAFVNTSQVLIALGDNDPTYTYAPDLTYGISRSVVLDGSVKPIWYGIGNSYTIIGSTAWADNVRGKVCGSVSANSQSGSFNGSTITTGTVSTGYYPLGYVGPVYVYVGNSGNNGSQLNGYLERVTIWSLIRLDDTILPNITGTYFPEIGFPQKQNQFSFVHVEVTPETVAVSQGNDKLIMRSPHAFTITGIAGSLSTEGTTATQVNVKVNGVSIFSGNELTIDAGSRTSVGSTVAPNIVNPYVKEDDELTFDVDAAGLSAIGLKVILKGVYS